MDVAGVTHTHTHTYPLHLVDDGRYRQPKKPTQGGGTRCRNNAAVHIPADPEKWAQIQTRSDDHGDGVSEMVAARCREVAAAGRRNPSTSMRTKKIHESTRVVGVIFFNQKIE